MARNAANLRNPGTPRPLAAFDPAEVDAVALKAFFNLVAEWDLHRDAQVTLLGAPSQRTFYRWRAGKVAGLPRDTLERISVLIGIYKAINILLPVRERAAAWIKRPNKAFGGESALEVMLKGKVDNLYHVRRYLDAWRG
ncbi:MAG TPA: MbcA/ParS/Xre antitoxin family protein [Woeseiaceae bacterium]|nr:MbcA/ParS/Xre antitoxin family protein [Woeseiaceae bacterium]